MINFLKEKYRILYKKIVGTLILVEKSWKLFGEVADKSNFESCTRVRTKKRKKECSDIRNSRCEHFKIDKSKALLKKKSSITGA